MKMAIGLCFALIDSAASAQGSHWVSGYERRDGTYVQGHEATNPNGNAYDNWSSRGNVNPYTGQSGTVDPYRAQQREDANRAQSSYGSIYPQ